MFVYFGVSVEYAMLIFLYCRFHFPNRIAGWPFLVSNPTPRMAFWNDNISNISDEELCKDDLRLDSILAKEVTVSEDLIDQDGSATSEDVSEVVDLSLPSKRKPCNNDEEVNIEEHQAVDLSLRTNLKPQCSNSEKDVTLEESSVFCQEKSQKKNKLLDILRLASRTIGDQGIMLCHLCDLEVSF